MADQVVIAVRICQDCGTQFHVTQKEIDWLTAHFQKVLLPRICRPCRRARRDQSGVGGNPNFQQRG